MRPESVTTEVFKPQTHKASFHLIPTLGSESESGLGVGVGLG